MLQETGSDNFQSLEDIFQVIQEYHDINLNKLLKEIARQKGVSVAEFFKRLRDKGYILSIETLYRYFSSSRKSNRFPPQEFIPVFSEVLQLNDRQTRLLYQFWKYYKLIKRCECEY